MKLVGEKVPGNPSEIPGALADQVEVCISEGATGLVAPATSISFKTLIKNLEKQGVIRPKQPASTSTELADSVPSLQGTHRAEVHTP